MATTLQAESFADVNLRERSTLNSACDPNAVTLILASTQGYSPNETIYIGVPGREGCEGTVIQSVDSPVGLTLASPLKLPHARFEPVTGVLGGYIHVYRAANLDDFVPKDGTFTLLATRQIDADQTSTYYTDSSGGSAFWYKLTYYDPMANTETALAEATPTRGSDFGHYASISDIRREAGFQNATNLSDVTIDQQRRAAESEINMALSSGYTVPFKPVPDFINTLTTQLAAAFLLFNAYGSQGSGANKIKAARLTLQALADRTQDLPGADGATAQVNSHPNSEPCEGGPPRNFTMEQRF